MDGQRAHRGVPRHRRAARTRPRPHASPTTAKSAPSSTGSSNRSKENASTGSPPASKRRLPDGSRLTAAIPPGQLQRARDLLDPPLQTQSQLARRPRRARFPLPAGGRLPRRRCPRRQEHRRRRPRLLRQDHPAERARPRDRRLSERIVVCESSAELQLPRVLANCVGYEARPGNTRRASRRSRSKTSSPTRCG